MPDFILSLHQAHDDDAPMDKSDSGRIPHCIL